MLIAVAYSLRYERLKNLEFSIKNTWLYEENIVSKNYHPIKFVKSYDLNNLPDEKIFIAELTLDDEDE